MALFSIVLLALSRPAPAKQVAVALTDRLPEAVAAAQKLVEKVRGVPFKGQVASAMLPEKELGKMLERKLSEDLPAPFPMYEKTLLALGLIEPVPELEKKILRLYTRQVAGFYDPAERKFYIVPERAGPASTDTARIGVSMSDLMEETLLSHELTHALQDRRLGLDKRMKALKDDTDAALALHSVLEGEATVVMTEGLLSRLPPESRALLATESLTSMIANMSAMEPIEGSEGVPDFFLKELLFPYAAGAAWIQARRLGTKEGDWSRIDEVYKKLPETTSEIMHPHTRYEGRLRLTEKERNLASDLPAGATVIYADTLGEWVIKTLIEKTSQRDDAEEAPMERHDDRILFFEDASKRVGFLWKIRCASPQGAQKLATELRIAYLGRVPFARPYVTVAGDRIDVRLGVRPPEPRPEVTPASAGPPPAAR